MTVIEQDAWCYTADRAEPEQVSQRLSEVLELAGYGARISLRGLLVGWMLLGPPPAPERPGPGARRGCPGL